MAEPLIRYLPGQRAVPNLTLQGDSSNLDWAGFGFSNGYARSYFTRSAMVTVVDALVEHPLTCRIEAVRDLLLVRAALSCDCSYEPLNHGRWEFRRPEISVCTIPRGTSMQVSILPGAQQRGVTVLLQPAALFEQYGVVCDDLPPQLRHFIEGRSAVPAIEATLPMRPEIASLIDDLRHSRLMGSLRLMQIEGRAAELLAMVASTWKARTAEDVHHGLRCRDAELLSNARRILLSRCTQPPKLQELASELGTNRTKLNQLFRSCMGVTPQEYALQRRIERAQALIAEGRLNVGQVANEVGYQHQSSFTTAFREVTGMSPREYAQTLRTPALAGATHH